MPSWQSTSRIGCPIDNPARRSRGAAPSTRPQWTRVPLDFRPRWRYVVNKAGAANAAPALKYKFCFTPHFCGYTEFGIVPGTGIAQTSIAGIMSLCGYISPTGSAVVQSQSAINSIINIYMFGPLLIFVGVLIVGLLYQLDKKYPAIMKELAEREARGEL